MSSFRHTVAAAACAVCKSRKKGCDKRLPVCGYCHQRNLKCSYTIATENDGLEAQQRNNNSHTIGDRPYLEHESSFSTTTSTAGSFGTPVPYADPTARILQMLATTRGPLTTIRDGFFQGIHRWLPIVAPWRMSDAALNFGRSPVKLDTVVLLLAMSLCTQQGPTETGPSPHEPSHTEYLTAKASFAQAQADLTATIPLLQAGILIATHEFGRQLAQPAYVTIQTCHGIRQLLEINHNETNDESNYVDANSALRAVEFNHVAQGLATIDRLVILEAADQGQHDVATFPAILPPLPVSFGQTQDVDPEILTAASFDPAVESAMQSYMGHGFMRQAQAAAILDQILRQLRDPCSSNEKLRSLQGLDDHLQGFLSAAMEKYRLPGHHCGAIAISIRTLFFLHQQILALRTTTQDLAQSNEDYETNSTAALDSAARMMAAVAHSHMKDVSNLDILPLTAAYNVRIAAQHLRTRAQTDVTLSPAEDLESLRVMDEAFRRRWQRGDDTPSASSLQS